MTLGAVAHGELDAEIDPEPEKQRHEGDRDEVELADNGKADPCRDDEAREQCHQHGDDHAPRAQREEKHQGDGRDRQGAVEAGIFGDGGEFLIREGHGAGEPHGDAVVARQPELGGFAADEVDGLAARLQGVVVELGLDQDEAPELARLGLAVRQEHLPGQPGRLAGQHALERPSKGRHRCGELVERGLAGPDALGAEGEGPHQAAQARIGGERAEEGLLGDELLGRPGELVGGQEQEPVAVEERAAIRLPDAAQQVVVRPERLRQPVGRLGGPLGRIAVDDDEHQVRSLRERLVEGGFVQAPGHVGRDQARRLGVDREARDRREEAERREDAAEADDQPRPVRAEGDDTLDHAGPMVRVGVGCSRLRLT